MQDAANRLLDPQTLIDEYRAYKVEKSRSYSGPSQANRCSTLGHPCTAYCFFDRTVAPKDRKEISPELAAIFDEGRSQERLFSRDLNDMGWNVEGGQGSLFWKQFVISGHRDFTLKRGASEEVRAEFKSVHPALFDKLNETKDIKEHRAWFIRKWYYQTVLYMLLDSQKKYWLILKNKSTGQPKVIVFEWTDEMYQDAEAMLQKAVVVNDRVEKGSVELVHKLSKEDVCSGCEFLDVCLPPLDFGVGVEVVPAEIAVELEALAKRRTELKPFKSEYDDVDEELKERVKEIAGKERETVVFGNWAAAITRQAIKGFVVKPFTKTVVKYLQMTRAFESAPDDGKSELERKLEKSLEATKK